MNFTKYALPLIVCGALFSTVRADPIYTVYDAANETTYSLEIDETTFAAASSLLESTPWWGDQNLAFQISSPFSGAYYVGGNADISAYFAIAVDGANAVYVNSDVPGLPYVFPVGDSTIAPYVVLASVPDTSSTLLLFSLAVAGLMILGGRALKFQPDRL